MKRKGFGMGSTSKWYLFLGAIAIVAALSMTGIYVIKNAGTQEEQNQTAQKDDGVETAQNNEEKTDVEDTDVEDTDAEGTDKENTDIEDAEDESARTSATDETESVASMIRANTGEGEDVVQDTAEVEKEAVISAETEDVAEAAESENVTSATVENHFSEDSILSWPVTGNVILNYSMDATVYFATLQQYQYNPAMIIQGDVNTKVVAAASGTVTAVETNEETGCTVTIDLGDGYAAVYGQLKEVQYEVGDYVEAGSLLGNISEPTKYYSVEGSNLFFEVTKDQVPVNPMNYLQ